MSWFRALFRDRHGPDERSRKGAELVELHADSTAALEKVDHAIAERDRVVKAVRNTVKAVRRQVT